MIGNSSNINPHSYNTHDHEITKCLHETRRAKPEGGGAAAEAGASGSRLRQEQQNFSLRELFADGLRSLFTKASGFWGRQGMEEGQENPAAGEKNRAMQAAITGRDGERGLKESPAEDEAAGVLATAVIKPETKKEENLEEETVRKVGNIDGAVSGGLKKGQGGIQKFLQKFGEAAVKARQLLKREKRSQIPLSENNTELEIGNNSFLLDSYNKMGEYSSLAKDRSLEGKFKAKG